MKNNPKKRHYLDILERSIDNHQVPSSYAQALSQGSPYAQTIISDKNLYSSSEALKQIALMFVEEIKNLAENQIKLDSQQEALDSGREAFPPSSFPTNSRAFALSKMPSFIQKYNI